MCKSLDVGIEEKELVCGCRCSVVFLLLFPGHPSQSPVLSGEEGRMDSKGQGFGDPELRRGPSPSISSLKGIVRVQDLPVLETCRPSHWCRQA